MLSAAKHLIPRGPRLFAAPSLTLHFVQGYGSGHWLRVTKAEVSAQERSDEAIFPILRDCFPFAAAQGFGFCARNDAMLATVGAFPSARLMLFSNHPVKE
jgi:hypothetical protein